MSLSLLLACSTPGASSGTDGGDRADTGSAETDSGSDETDSGSEDVDSGSEETDGGEIEVDGGDVDVDGGDVEADVDAATSGPCVEPGLGQSCGDTAGGAACPTGFECDLGRCLPQDRATCGGFAGAPCTDPVRNECLYQTGHGDVGTCFSPSEVRCLCSVEPGRWSC
jgi:hypothetical protein